MMRMHYVDSSHVCVLLNKQLENTMIELMNQSVKESIPIGWKCGCSRLIFTGDFLSVPRAITVHLLILYSSSLLRSMDKNKTNTINSFSWTEKNSKSIPH